MENSVTFEAGLEYGATFRFPVAWSYITAAPTPETAPKPVPKPAPIPLRTPDPEAIQQAVAIQAPAPVQAKVETPTPVPAPVPVKKAPEQEATQKAAPPGEAKWEMVIPKMARPASARPPRVLQAAGPALSKADQPARGETEQVTEVSFYADSEASFLPRRWKLFGMSAAVVTVAFAIVWVRPGGEAPAANDSAAGAAGTWSRRTAYVVGAKDPRDLLVYSGSDGLKNYRIEFAWTPDSRGVGWIFRASDSANYYAARLRLMQAGSTPTLSMEHFTVAKGVEGTHSRKVITLGRTSNQVLVRMDANGPAFTLYLQGSPADYWTDERFDSGSLGFFEERAERPVVQALRFTLFKKTGLQTVVTSLE